MKYTVTINEKSKTIIVNLDGYEGVSKCCETDTFNLQTGIELALERAKVAKANAEAKKGNCPNLEGYGNIKALVKALEKALPKGQIVIVGNGDGLTAEQKRWLLSLSEHKCSPRCCEGECYTDDEIDEIKTEAYDEGYADGEASVDDRYDEGYADGHSDGYDEGYDDGTDECDYADEMRERIKEILDEYSE